MLKPLPFLRPFYLDDVGAPLTGGKLFTWDNNTQTDKPTWQDPLAAALNTNPIILNGGGRFDCFLEPGLYTMRLEDSLGALIWERDDVSGEDSSSFSVVDTIADMKAIASGSLTQVLVLGYNTPGDGGGGAFIYDPAISIAEDFGVTFIGDDAPANGRWVRMIKDEISIRYFGAVGDGVTDDKIAIENAISYCTSPGHSRTMFAPTSPTTPYTYLMVTNPTGLDGSLGKFTFHVYDNAQLNFSAAPTIKCNFIAGSYRIFAVGSTDPIFDAECTFESGPYPEWWGALNDGTGDQSVAIVAWLNCGASVLYTSSGVYEVVGSPALAADTMLIMGALIKEAANPPYIPRGIYIVGGSITAYNIEANGGLIVALDAAIGANLSVGADAGITGEVNSGSVVTGALSASDAVIGTSLVAGTFLQAKAGTGTKSFKASGNIAAIIGAGSYTLPASSLVNVGDSLLIVAQGEMSGSGGAITINIGTRLLTLTFAIGAASTSDRYRIEARAVVTAANTLAIVATAWFREDGVADYWDSDQNTAGITLTNSANISVDCGSETQKILTVDFFPASP